MRFAGSTLFSVRILFAAIALFVGSGCDLFDDGLSDRERLLKSQDQAVEELKKLGAKLEERKYPQGNAWAVDLSGMTISEATFDLLKKAGHITELNFGGSTITDDYMPKLDDVELTGILLKLNLSKTAVTDQGVGGLKNLMFLRELDLTGTKVTSTGIDRLKKNRQDNSAISPGMKKIKILQ